jgi:hypothetical protein
MEISLDLSTMSNIAISNLLLVMKVGQPNLQICIKGIHGKGFRGGTKIFSASLIRSSVIPRKLSPVNGKKSYSLGDGIIPPLNSLNLSVGLRFHIPDMQDMRRGQGMHQ